MEEYQLKNCYGPEGREFESCRTQYEKPYFMGFHSFLNVNLEQCGCGKDEVFSSSFSKIQTSETLCFWGFLSVYIERTPISTYNKRQCVKK